MTRIAPAIAAVVLLMAIIAAMLIALAAAPKPQAGVTWDHNQHTAAAYKPSGENWR